jgi:AraC family transcriptional regulator, transcriptional activator for feuABC-ybbA operon
MDTSHQNPYSAAASSLFRFINIRPHTRTESWLQHKAMNEAHELLIFIEGDGRMDQDGEYFAIGPGSCLCLGPGTSSHIYCSPGNRLVYYSISFHAYQSKDASRNNNNCHSTDGNGGNGNIDSINPHSPFPPGWHTVTSPPSILQQLAQSLLDACPVSPDSGDLRTSGSPAVKTAAKVQLSSLRQQLYFHELLLHVFESEAPAGPGADAMRAVSDTIAYMEQGYKEPLTIALLAEQASLPQWQYRSLFKEITGKKPNEYLTELRISRSKQHLANSKRPLREIAAEVGFADEYYFIRRFRQLTGVTPRQYGEAVRKKQRVVDWTGHEIDIPAHPEFILCHKEVCGDLNALGLPAAGSLDGWLKDNPDSGNENLIKRKLFLQSGILRKGLPDLILFANSDEQKYNMVSSIAPTVSFNSFATLDNRMKTLGKLLNKQRDAELWLQRYRSRQEIMWHGLGGNCVDGETASVFIYEHGKRLFVMGSAGFAPGLYHPCGFQAPPAVAQMLAEEEGFREITEEEIPMYTGDRIFLLLSRNPVSRAATHELIRSPLWQALDAAKSRHVYLIEADKWNFGDALSRWMALDAISRLLKGQSG